MSKPKIYVFTSDCFMKEATVLEDTVFIVVPNSQYHIINHDKYGEIKIDNSHLDNLLQSGTIIDYPEPKDLKNPSYSIETLVKERDKLKLELERTEDAFEQMTFRRMENGAELTKERDANFQIAAKLKSAEKDLEGMKSKYEHQGKILKWQDDKVNQYQRDAVTRRFATKEPKDDLGLWALAISVLAALFSIAAFSASNQ